jgi:hypothetical protein
VNQVPLSSKEERAPHPLSVVATWQHPGSESLFWTVDPDGCVHCYTRPHAGRLAGLAHLPYPGLPA